MIAAGEDIERRLAAAALTKRREGRIPTQRETRALRRIEARQEEELRWRYYATIPLKHWEAMSGGLGRKVIRDQATRYAIPFSGPVIDLTAVVAALHRFLADHAVLLSAAAGRGKAFGETTHAAETRLKIAKADLLELELHKTRGELIDQSEAARRRSAIVQWVLDLFGRAPAELAAALAGKKPRQVRRVIEDYFDRVRRDVAAGGS